MYAEHGEACLIWYALEEKVHLGIVRVLDYLDMQPPPPKKKKHHGKWSSGNEINVGCRFHKYWIRQDLLCWCNSWNKKKKGRLNVKSGTDRY